MLCAFECTHVCTMTADDVTIRWATVEDAGAIADVHIASWRAAYRDLLPAERLAALDLATRTRQWSEWLSAGGERRETLAAVRGGEIVGFATLRMPTPDPGEPDDVAEIPALYLRPEARRAGIGRRLVNESLREMRDRGFREAILWMLEGNEPARAFYEATGWRLDGAGRRASQYFPELAELVEVRFRRAL
jgi:ribosomal protein S18 acetylase RimI-like enzyme